MSTFREVIYMCSDQLKLSSDDAFFTNDHILYLIKKYRGLLLDQRYKDIRKEIPLSNYQTICLDLEKDNSLSYCGRDTLLKSAEVIPNLLTVGNVQVYPVDYYNSEITYVSKERMKYVGHNKWLQNIIYCSLAPNNYLYLKSSNPQFKYLKKIKMTGIFEDIEEVEKLKCENDTTCDILDSRFPLEEALIPQLIEVVVKFMTSGLYKPEDTENNASDDMANMMSFIRQNMKSNLQKQLE